MWDAGIERDDAERQLIDSSGVEAELVQRTIDRMRPEIQGGHVLELGSGLDEPGAGLPMPATRSLWIMMRTLLTR